MGLEFLRSSYPTAETGGHMMPYGTPLTNDTILVKVVKSSQTRVWDGWGSYLACSLVAVQCNPCCTDLSALWTKIEIIF